MIEAKLPSKNILLFFTVSFLIFSCGEEKSEKKESTGKIKGEKTISTSSLLTEKFHFMEGNWVDASGTMPGFNEKWVVKNDTLIQIIGYFVTNTDTAIMEAIKVKLVNDKIYYIPKVEDQNNGKEITYEFLSKSTVDSVIFANYKHDFPQEIIYVKKSPDSVVVYLKGIDEEKKPKDYILQLKKENQAVDNK